MKFDLRDAWNRQAVLYQQKHKIDTAHIYYGSRVPTEDELQLIGSVQGLNVLDLGCGGGQSSIAFGRRGATVIGVDFSEAQLVFARELATKEGVEVSFLCGDIRDVSFLQEAAQDLVFSADVLFYLDDVAECFKHVERILRLGGVFVFSVDHPFWDCFDVDNKQDPMHLVRSYFERGPIYWEWAYDDGTRVGMNFYPRPMSDWFRALRGAGFVVEDVVEPRPVDKEDPWSEYYPMELASFVPTTIIFKARKRVRNE